jgi:thiol-disulfide isomerase/thioredoxin
MIVELTRESFRSVVSRDGIVLVSCHSPWCGSCKAAAPHFARVAEEHPEHAFATLDTNAEQELAGELSIHHVPALLVYRDGIQLLCQPGGFDTERLEFVLEKAAALDMDKVRAELAAERPE